jgi:hypothetical protein
MTDEKNTARVVSPHDKVIKTAYSDLENARSLLSDRLPDKVLSRLFPERQGDML